MQLAGHMFDIPIVVCAQQSTLCLQMWVEKEQHRKINNFILNEEHCDQMKERERERVLGGVGIELVLENALFNVRVYFLQLAYIVTIFQLSKEEADKLGIKFISLEEVQEQALKVN